MAGLIGTKEQAYVTYDEIDALKTVPRKRNWKPFAIKLPYLISIVLLCLSCIILLEVLLRHSIPLDDLSPDALDDPKRSVEVSVLARAPGTAEHELSPRATSTSASPSPVPSNTTPSKNTPTVVNTSPKTTAIAPAGTTQLAVTNYATNTPAKMTTTANPPAGTSSKIVTTRATETPTLTTSNLKTTSTNAPPSTKSTTNMVCPTSVLTLSVTVFSDGKNPPVTKTAGLGPVDTCVKTVTITVTRTESYLQLTSRSTTPLATTPPTTTPPSTTPPTTTPPSTTPPSTTPPSTTPPLTTPPMTTPPMTTPPTTIVPVTTIPTTTASLATPSAKSSTNGVCPTSIATLSVTVWNDGKNAPVTITVGLGPVDTCVKTVTITVTRTDSYLQLTSVTALSTKQSDVASTTSDLESTSKIASPTKDVSTTTGPSYSYITSTSGYVGSMSETTVPTRDASATTGPSYTMSTSIDLGMTSKTTVPTKDALPTTGISSSYFTSTSSYLELMSRTTTPVSFTSTSRSPELTSTMLLIISGAPSSTTGNLDPSSTSASIMYTRTSSGYPYIQISSATSSLASTRAMSGPISGTSTGSGSTDYYQPLIGTTSGQSVSGTGSSNSNFRIITASVSGTKTSDSSSATNSTSYINRVSKTMNPINEAKPSTITSVYTSDNGQVVTSTEIVQPSAVSYVPQPTYISTVQNVTKLRRPDLLVGSTGELTSMRYFACVYLPSIIAIIVKEAWSVTASGLKMTEPFYQFNKSDGGSSRKSLMADYVGGTDSLYSIRSALRGDKPMLVIMAMNIIMLLLAPLSTEAITILPLLVSRSDAGVRHTEYILGWVLNRLVVRILQGVLSFSIVVILVIAIVDRRRHSGLLANPSKIATLASLYNHPSTINDLHQINPNASDKEIEAAIAHNRYKITAYEDVDGNRFCGIVKVGEITPRGTHRLPQDDISNTGRSSDKSTKELTKRNRMKRAVWYRLVDGFLLFLLIGILAVLVAYWLDGTSSGLHSFFNSGGFGPRFILSLSASIMTTTFQSIEREVRLVTPYRLLANRNASPWDTILRPVNGTAVSNLVQNIKYGAWFGFFIGLVTVSGDILIIMIAGVPFISKFTQGITTASWSTSVALTALMFIGSISVFFWRRKNKKLKIPTEPNGSIVRIWMSISNPGNQLRTLLSEPGDMSSTSLRTRIKRDRARYWAGWVQDDYARNVWCIDKEHPAVQTPYRQNLTSPLGDTRLEYQHISPDMHPAHFFQRDETSQRLSLIQTEYQGGSTERVRPECTDHIEQTYPLVQPDYQDNLVDHREPSQQSYTDFRRYLEEGDVSVRENTSQQYRHTQTDNRESSGRSRAGAKSYHLF